MATVTDKFKEKYTEMNLFETAEEQVLNQAKLNEITAALGFAGVTPAINGFATGTVIATALGGNVSTSVFDFGTTGQFANNIRPYPSLVRITTVIGATPSCTYAIQGSVDNSTYTALQYADSATPTTFVNTTFVLTTPATTVVKIIKPNQVYRYLKVVFTLNTNITNTIDVYPMAGNLDNVAVI